MPRGPADTNTFQYIVYEGQECVQFQTTGKYRVDVLVDRDAWDNYLSQHTWTVTMNKSGRASVKTSIDNYTCFIWRLIIEHTYGELDYWGRTIDHINNNPLDNRISNLRLCNAMLNGANISSKFDDEDRRYIHENKNKTGGLAGYKIHFNVGGKAYYVASFSVSEYGSPAAALNAAKEYRDKHILQERERIIQEIERKSRNIEFERGLRDKLAVGETDEIVQILERYGIHTIASCNPSTDSPKS